MLTVDSFCRCYSKVQGLPLLDPLFVVYYLHLDPFHCHWQLRPVRVLPKRRHLDCLPFSKILFGKISFSISSKQLKNKNSKGNGMENLQCLCHWFGLGKARNGWGGRTRMGMGEVSLGRTECVPEKYYLYIQLPISEHDIHTINVQFFLRRWRWVATHFCNRRRRCYCTSPRVAGVGISPLEDDDGPARDCKEDRMDMVSYALTILLSTSLHENI